MVRSSRPAAANSTHPIGSLPGELTDLGRQVNIEFSLFSRQWLLLLKPERSPPFTSDKHYEGYT